MRNDNPRRLMRSQIRQEKRTARGLRPSSIEVTVTERRRLSEDLGAHGVPPLMVEGALMSAPTARSASLLQVRR